MCLVSMLLPADNLDKPVKRVLKNLQIDMAREYSWNAMPLTRYHGYPPTPVPGEKKHDPTLSELLEIASSIVEGGITTTTITTGNKRSNQVTAGETATKKTKTSSTIS